MKLVRDMRKIGTVDVWPDLADWTEPHKSVQRRKHKPRPSSVIKRMQRAGIDISAVTVAPDGSVTLKLDKPSADIVAANSDEIENEWDVVKQ